MKKRLKRRNMQPEQKTDRNPVLLRVKFLTIAAQRQIHALHHQPRSRSLARERASGGLWGAFEQGIWCGRAEVVLDDNTQFLHDNWNDIPEGGTRFTGVKDCGLTGRIR
jgi:hypothetical protein